MQNEYNLKCIEMLKIDTHFFKLVSALPQDVLSIIFEMIPNRYKLILNKSYYNSLHYLMPTFIRYYDYYIHQIIVKDMDVAFKALLTDNFFKWLSIKKYRHFGMRFSNYIEFLKYLCIESNAIKCLTLIETCIELIGLNKKGSKNKINRTIKWIN
jgi:hypothetical protein